MRAFLKLRGPHQEEISSNTFHCPIIPTGLFYGQTPRDEKGAVLLDANTRWGSLSAYYFLDDYSLNNPYPSGQGGASISGFNASTTGRAQLLSLERRKPSAEQWPMNFTSATCVMTTMWDRRLEALVRALYRKDSLTRRVNRQFMLSLVN